MNLVLPYPPSANKYWRMVTIRGRSRMVVSAAAKAFKKQVKELAAKANATPLQGALSLSVWLFRPQRSGDLDNRLKCLMDALNGLAWDDDKQVVEIHAYRLDDKQNPRVEVTVGYVEREATPVPVGKPVARASKAQQKSQRRIAAAQRKEDKERSRDSGLRYVKAYSPPRFTAVDAAKEAEETFAPPLGEDWEPKP